MVVGVLLGEGHGKRSIYHARDDAVHLDPHTENTR